MATFEDVVSLLKNTKWAVKTFLIFLFGLKLGDLVSQFNTFVTELKPKLLHLFLFRSELYRNLQGNYEGSFEV